MCHHTHCQRRRADRQARQPRADRATRNSSSRNSSPTSLPMPSRCRGSIRPALKPRRTSTRTASSDLIEPEALARRSATRSPTRPTARRRLDSFACRGSSDDGVRRPLARFGTRSSAAQASAVDVCRAALTRIEQTNPSLNAFNHVVAERAHRARRVDRSAARGWRDARAAGRRTGGAEGQPVRQRRAHDRVIEDSRQLPSPLQRDRRRETGSGRRGHRRQDQLRRVRDGVVEREFGVRTGAQSVGDRSHARADRAAVRRRLLPRSACRSRSDRIPADRSGSRHRSAGSSG